jgi:hypothetical protein
MKGHFFLSSVIKRVAFSCEGQLRSWQGLCNKGVDEFYTQGPWYTSLSIPLFVKCLLCVKYCAWPLRWRISIHLACPWRAYSLQKEQYNQATAMCVVLKLAQATRAATSSWGGKESGREAIVPLLSEPASMEWALTRLLFLMVTWIISSL